MASVQLALQGCLSNCLISLVFSALKFRARLIFGTSRAGTKVLQAPQLTIAARRPQIACGSGVP
jgi:hypothetical protein